MNKKRITLGLVTGFLGTLLCFGYLVFYLYGEMEETFYNKTAQLIAIGVENDATMEQQLVSSLKKDNPQGVSKGRDILRKYGYEQGSSLSFYQGNAFRKVMIGLVLLIALLFFYLGGFLMWMNKKSKGRIQDLTEYVYYINEGNYTVKPQREEDEFILLEDEIYKTVVMLRESQERERGEKEKLHNNLVDISHQLKTPLTAMGLMVELLEQGSLPREEKIYVEKISSQIQRLNHLVINLLTLSKLDLGVLTLEYQPVNVGDILSTAVEPMVLPMEKKEQKLFIEGNKEAVVMGDFHWMSEAITNIVKNCSEHTPFGGEIRITVEKNPIYTELVIEDTGGGFDSNDLPHLFTRFYKGKNSAKDSVGIGLALAKSIIKRQNGDIMAENRPGGGARFILKFFSN